MKHVREISAIKNPTVIEQIQSTARAYRNISNEVRDLAYTLCLSGVAMVGISTYTKDETILGMGTGLIFSGGLALSIKSD